ncbi:uncharacterized protein LOC132612215 [Lycium barbarum]|uniref:uncharacterized protein LOC132612215 n=1 Tax=Lycium barbarum TaxID=112863 RepID=UPI00293F6DE5|nr:uncharacterized protein LOC132612215 [Lycium barbarum]
MDLEKKKKKKKRIAHDRSRIGWGSLTLSSAQELGEKLMALGARESRGDASSMWDRTASCIREAPREVLGVSRVKRKGEKPTEGESSKRAKVQTPLDKLVTAICQSTNEERVSETGASEREEIYETSVGHEEERDEENVENVEGDEEEGNEGDERGEGDEGGEEDAEIEKGNEKEEESIDQTLVELKRKRKHNADANLVESSSIAIDPNRPSIDEIVKSFSIEKYGVTMPLNGNNDLSGDFVVRSSMGKGFDTFRGILRQQGLENFFRASCFGLYLDLPEDTGA